MKITALKNLKLKNLAPLVATLALLNSQVSMARPSMDDVKVCQGLMDFIQLKLNDSRAKYSAKDINVMAKGVNDYNAFIQEHFVTPGLAFQTLGDEKKAIALQEDINTYKKNLVEKFQRQFPQKQLELEFAVSLNDCTKKVTPQGKIGKSVQATLVTMVNLTKPQ